MNDNPNSPQWGYTLGGLTRVWRSGVGIDARGNLIYVVADGQTVITLAKILQHAGAVRAMEFDINPEWHTLITYTHGANGLVPTTVGPNPMQPPTRYLVPDDRDFFAVYRPCPVRSPSPSSRDPAASDAARGVLMREVCHQSGGDKPGNGQSPACT